MPVVRFFLILSSLTGFGSLAAVLLGHAPSLSFLCGALLLHACLATLGVLAPSLQVWTRVHWRGAPGGRRVALTFDDGPHPETTRRVLALLAERGQRATFFVIGEKVRKHPDVVREIAAAGHALGVHGDEHDRLYALRSVRRLTRDLELAQGSLSNATGSTARWFRPPVGFVSHSVALAAERCGLELVGWGTRALDGRAVARSDRVLRRVLGGLADGAVLLLHDAAEADDRVPASLAILPDLFDAIEARGLRSVTLDELFGPP